MLLRSSSLLRHTIKTTLSRVRTFMKTEAKLERDANYDENFNSTTVNILHREIREVIIIQTFSNFGFRLNTGLFALGPIAVLPTAMFSWTVGSYHDINAKSLSLFWLLEPKVDILVIGTGETREFIDPDVRPLLQSKGISYEVQDTRQACATYNYLASEKRNVGVALIPPLKLVPEGLDEQLQSYNIKGHYADLDTREYEGKVEADHIEEAFHTRAYDKWWAGEYGTGKFKPPGLTDDYQEKLEKWKTRVVHEDDKVPFDRFEAKTEREMIKEKEGKASKPDDPTSKGD